MPHAKGEKLAYGLEHAGDATWADGRPVYAAIDNADAAQPFLAGCPANIQVLSLLRTGVCQTWPTSAGSTLARSFGQVPILRNRAETGHSLARGPSSVSRFQR